MLVFGNTAFADSTWKFEDTQYNYDSGYEYKVFFYKWVDEMPEPAGAHDYDYAGPSGDPGFEVYSWVLDLTVIVPEDGALVWGEVFNRINGGDWYHVDTIEGEQVP